MAKPPPEIGPRTYYSHPHATECPTCHRLLLHGDLVQHHGTALLVYCEHCRLTFVECMRSIQEEDAPPCAGAIPWEDTPPLYSYTVHLCQIMGERKYDYAARFNGMVPRHISHTNTVYYLQCDHREMDNWEVDVYCPNCYNSLTIRLFSI